LPKKEPKKATAKEYLKKKIPSTPDTVTSLPTGQAKHQITNKFKTPITKIQNKEILTIRNRLWFRVLLARLAYILTF
jgi:hypothetical protein